ncbi:hypothetical protein VINI7043_14295 [Vibrio nigripulchritudo ATCC 27043]|nr:hypothetical protein VINI7043_14295 [Vibrio nigripulchritudo ATCC 27043]
MSSTPEKRYLPETFTYLKAGKPQYQVNAGGEVPSFWAWEYT